MTAGTGVAMGKTQAQGRRSKPAARGPRRHGVRRTIIGLAMVAAVYVGITTIQVWNGSTWDETADADADAAVVLGAAQYDGRPSEVYQGRLDHAADLYRAGTVSVVLVTGAGAEGDRFTEAYSGLTYLRGKGIPEADLLVVDDGSSTWESLAAAKRVLVARDVGDVLLVSDPYHSFRLKEIADEVGMSARVSPTEGGARFTQFVRESGLVSVGRLIGYRRLANLVG